MGQPCLGNHYPPGSRHQRGVSLVIALVLLLMLTILGLAASQVTIQQERMAGNYRESNEAFQNAEATLREIERRIIQVAQGGTGNLGVIPLWSEIDDLDSRDCSLQIKQPWNTPYDSACPDDGDVPWSTAPDTGYCFTVIDLGDSVDPVSGLPIGSACRPIAEAGTNAAGEYFLVVARAQGSAQVGEAVVQSIFFWPE